MSTFWRSTKNPKTGEWDDKAVWRDNYFAPRHYGVVFTDGTIIDPEKVDLEVRDVEVKAEETPVYAIKKIVQGSVIGKEGNFVAVPDINYDTGVTYLDKPFVVKFKEQWILIKDWKEEAVTFRVFGDRLKRGNYRLGYFKWPH